LPDWLPIIGGNYMSLWPVFNIADASIFTSVFIILIWQKSFFIEEETNLE
jgi:signal peptidase II